MAAHKIRKISNNSSQKIKIRLPVSSRPCKAMQPKKGKGSYRRKSTHDVIKEMDR